MNYVIATNKKWNFPMRDSLEINTGCSFILIKNNEKLTLNLLSKINPKYVFFPHWSYRIPEEVFKNFECVIFHMTDVPFGRGGSPLQNLLERGIYQTKMSALKCVRKMDAGPVYLKKDLSLHGNAEEIYIRAGKIIEEMIVEIIKNNPVPREQTGDVVEFKRRKPEQSDISGLQSIEQIFDYFRMLDAEGYPKAFLNLGDFKLEFSRASLKNGYIMADVKIFQDNNE
jgi:methionyl-tRNA formyltransferase